MTQFTHGHALIIGAGGDLPNTVEDANGLAAILRDPERCAYPSGQVQLLTGAAATREAILTGLKTLAGQTDPTATVVVYFSGHGYRVETLIGAATYLLPHGYNMDRLPATAVSGQELSDHLRAIPAQKLLLLLDCCHAGGLDDIKAPGATFTKAPIPPEAEALLTEGRGRVIIASSRADELSYAGKPYSAFTLALIEALCGSGPARQDGSARATDLALHAREKVPQRTWGRQHPILNYQQADNFAVAYYAAGDSQPKGLPFTATPEIEPAPGAFRGITTSYQASATGGSAVAQDHSTAVGSRGVLNIGRVGGSISTGDGNRLPGEASDE